MPPRSVAWAMPRGSARTRDGSWITRGRTGTAVRRERIAASAQAGDAKRLDHFLEVLPTAPHRRRFSQESLHVRTEARDVLQPPPRRFDVAGKGRIVDDLAISRNLPRVLEDRLARERDALVMTAEAETGRGTDIVVHAGIAVREQVAGGGALGIRGMRESVGRAAGVDGGQRQEIMTDCKIGIEPQPASEMRERLLHLVAG